MDNPQLTVEEKRALLAKLLQEKRQGVRLGSDEPGVLSLFAEQVSRVPEAIAIVSDRQRLTYAELDKRSSLLAQHLQTLGVGQDTIIGLAVPRSAEQIVAGLAILKAGGAWLPLEPVDARVRRARMIQETKPALLLVRGKTDQFPVDVPILDMDAIDLGGDDVAPIDTRIGEQDLCLVVWPGERPLLLEHRVLAARLAWLRKSFPQPQRGVFLHASSLHGDAALLELFWPLACGATIVVASEAVQTENLMHLICEEHVSVAHVPPSLLSPLEAASLRQVFVSGPVAGKIRSALAGRGIEACGLYSIPEAGGPLAVHDSGSPVPDRCLKLLDSYQRPVPVGVVGQVHIEGPVARGLSHPLLPTGDRARQRSDGSLEWLGGSGRTASINCFRVDLSHVADVILSADDVADCRVIAREDANGEPHLLAYVVPAGALEMQGLQDWIKARLAPWQRPALVPVSSIPLTDAGLTDDRLLFRLPVIDSALERLWEQAFEKLDCVSQVAVVSREKDSSLGEISLPVLAPLLIKEGKPISNMDEGRPPAVADGGPLVIPPDASRTLTEALLRTVAEYGAKTITFLSAQGEPLTLSYADLLSEAMRVAGGLRAGGIKPGQSVILQVPNLRAYFPAFWGCVLAGIKPVTVACDGTYGERNAVVSKLINVWQLLDRPPILAASALRQPLSTLGRFADGAVFDVRALEEIAAHVPLAEPWQADPDDVLFLQLSSGSTGIPKCIQITHRGVVTHVHASVAFNSLASDDVSLNWLPMDHVVPLLTCHLRDTYLGCSQVVMDTMLVLADPLRWLDAIEAYHVTQTWSPNFGYKLVADAIRRTPGRQWDLSSVKSFMNAGEQATIPVIRDFLDLTASFGVEPSAMQPAFGMAEACTCMTFENDFSPDTSVFWVAKDSLGGTLRIVDPNDQDAIAFVKLGPPVPGVQIRIAGADNAPLCEGMIGQFQIKGDVITPGYYRNDDANREAFVGDGWFNSGDLGFILNGTLALTGREKELIIINGANFYCHEIEDVVNQVAGVLPTFAAACGIPVADTGSEALAIFFVAREGFDPMSLVGSIRQRVTMLTGVDTAYIIPVPRQEFPKTTSGKIQRRALRARLVEELGEKAARQTMPDWFYREVWVRREVEPSPKGVSHDLMLVFLDDAGLGKALLKHLDAVSRPWISVQRGAAFAIAGDRHYTLDPTIPDHFRQLFASLSLNGQSVQNIAFLWSYELGCRSPETQDDLERQTGKALGEMLHLLQALENHPEKGAFHLDVVSSCAFPAGTVINPALGGLRGLLRTAEQEVPHLTCRHIDLSGEALTSDTKSLLNEWSALLQDSEIAWRGGMRFVPRLDRVSFDDKKSQAGIHLRVGGRYLVTGGLGGIGRELVRYLRRICGASVLVIGRSTVGELPADLHVRGRGGELIYRAADVANHEAMSNAVRDAEERFGGPIEGVFHLAGVAHDRLIADETHEDLVNAMRAKVSGAWVLDRIFADRPHSWLVSWSSVNALFGGLRAGAYSAANSALDALVRSQHADAAPRLCLHWSRWDNIGMSNEPGRREFARARGYCTIGVEDGLRSLPNILAAGRPGIAIGLDASNPHIRKRMTDRPEALLIMKAYLVLHRDRVDPPALPQVTAPNDLFCNETVCTLLEADDLPRDSEGNVDKNRLAVLDGRDLGDLNAPRSETEATLAAIWSEVLGRKQLQSNDNFFEAGGHSIVAARLLHRISETFGIEMPLKVLFEKPTLAAMAAWLDAAKAQGVEGQAAVPSCVVPLHPEGDRRPFFCTHPAGGSPWCYLGLSKQLGRDQPFYGFQCPGLIDGEIPAQSVEELAELYVAAMRKIQPDGPYRIGGWSSGGPIAFEMARIVEQQGDRVEVLALFDCGVMESDTLPGRSRIVRFIYGMLQLMGYARQVRLPRSYEELRYLARLIGLPLPPKIRELRITRQFLRSLEHSRRMFNLNNTIGLRYRPQPIASRIVLFRAGGGTPDTDPIFMDLQRYASQQVERIEMPGNHMSLILDPEISAVLASRLTEVLQDGAAVRERSAGQVPAPAEAA